MERRDTRRFDYTNPGERTQRVDTEFAGTSREADLIVRGLKSLRAMVQLRDAAGISPLHSHFGLTEGQTNHDVPREDELSQLIQEIEDPNFVDPASRYVAPRTLADLD